MTTTFSSHEKIPGCFLGTFEVICKFHHIDLILLIYEVKRGYRVLGNVFGQYNAVQLVKRHDQLSVGECVALCFAPHHLLE